MSNVCDWCSRHSELHVRELAGFRFAVCVDGCEDDPHHCDWCVKPGKDGKLFQLELHGYRFVVCGPQCHWDLVVAFVDSLSVEEVGDIMQEVA